MKNRSLRSLAPRDNRAARRVKAQAILLAAKVAQDKYIRDLRTIMRGLHKHFMDGMAPHLQDITWRQDAHTSWKQKLGQLAEAIAMTREPVKKAFDIMSQRVNARNLEAAKTLLGVTPAQTGVAEAMSRFRDQNIRLIEDAGRDYADDMREIFEDPDSFGQRVETLKSRLLERGAVSESRAELIARDQTLKLNGQLNMLRQTNAGVSRYIWSTSHDERVRPEHVELDGTVQSWSDPPEPGHPGDDFQCRCVALPVLEDQEEEDSEDQE